MSIHNFSFGPSLLGVHMFVCEQICKLYFTVINLLRTGSMYSFILGSKGQGYHISIVSTQHESLIYFPATRRTWKWIKRDNNYNSYNKSGNTVWFELSCMLANLKCRGHCNEHNWLSPTNNIAVQMNNPTHYPNRYPPLDPTTKCSEVWVRMFVVHYMLYVQQHSNPPPGAGGGDGSVVFVLVAFFYTLTKLFNLDIDTATCVALYFVSVFVLMPKGGFSLLLFLPFNSTA